MKLLDKLTNLYLERSGDTSGTTFFHEVLVGCFFLKDGAQIKTNLDLQKFLAENKKIKSVDEAGHKEEIHYNEKFFGNQKAFEIEPSLVEDARSIARKFKQTYNITGITEVLWTGPTNSRGAYGAADVVIKTSTKEYPISLKKGTGQLKNATLGTFGESILMSKEQFYDAVTKDKSKYWDALTREWIHFFRKAGDTEVKNLLNKLKLSTWDEYIVAKWPEKTNLVKLFKGNGLILAKEKVEKAEKVSYLGSKLYENGAIDRKVWQGIRQTFFNKIFSDFFEKTQLTQKQLIKLFKTQISIGEVTLYFASNGGDKIYQIPSEFDFEQIVKNINFEYQTQSTGSGFILTIYALSKNKKIKLIEINIFFRFKFGEMVRVPDPTSAGTFEIENWNALLAQQ